jgi:hypothetical protein
MGTESSDRWNGYITMTTNALDREPVFFTSSVNDPADPLVAGSCGAIRCNGAGDFFDIVIGSDGTPWAAFVDVCAGPFGCEWIRTGVGVVGRLVGGQSLL